jgi:DNA repair ATPase RecN
MEKMKPGDSEIMLTEKFLTELQAKATWAIEAEKRKVNPTAKFDPAITPKEALELVACVRELEFELAECRTGHETDMTALRFQAKRVDDAEARVEELKDKIVIYEKAHYVMVDSICGYGEAKKAAGDMIKHVAAERDALQAKLDAVRAWLDVEAIADYPTSSALLRDDILAILDQPKGDDREK